MARLWVFSDFQLSNRPSRDVPLFRTMDLPEADVAVVAGDMFPALRRSIEVLAPLADRMPVVYVPGNRDFYTGTMEGNLEQALEIARNTGVNLLQNDQCRIAGVRFLGTTLWTDYALLGEVEGSMSHASNHVSDHMAITTSGRPFSPSDALEEHAKARSFLERALAVPHDGPTVVVSHHAPHPLSRAPRFAHDPNSAAFVSDLGSLMKGVNAPDLWVHGAVHDSFDYVVGNTRVLSNPLGYPGENPHFQANMVVEVSERAPAPAMA